MQLFALRRLSTGNFLGISVSSNGDDAEFCNDCTVRFRECIGKDMVWTTNDYEFAFRAASEDPDWYNSDVDTPKNDFVGDLEIVSFAFYGLPDA